MAITGEDMSSQQVNLSNEHHDHDLLRSKLMQRHEKVVSDLSAGWRLHHLWRALAWEDVISKYRRSAFGFIWIIFSFVSMVLIFVVLFGRSSPNMTSYEYTVYLATGLTAWNFISIGVGKACAVFASNGGWIRSTPAPLSILVFRAVLSVAYEVFIIFLCVIPLILILGIPSIANVATFLLAAFIYVVNLVFLCLLFGSIGAWSSDFQQLVPAIMRIGFFATPIFWDFNSTQGMRQILATYNPFTHFVQLTREPLMGNEPTYTNWVVALSITAGMIVVGTIVFKLARKRLAAWV